VKGETTTHWNIWLCIAPTQAAHLSSRGSTDRCRETSAAVNIPLTGYMQLTLGDRNPFLSTTPCNLHGRIVSANTRSTSIGHPTLPHAPQVDAMVSELRFRSPQKLNRTIENVEGNKSNSRTMFSGSRPSLGHLLLYLFNDTFKDARASSRLARSDFCND